MLEKYLIKNKKELDDIKKSFKQKIEYHQSIKNLWGEPLKYPCILITAWNYCNKYYQLMFIYSDDFIVNCIRCGNPVDLVDNIHCKRCQNETSDILLINNQL